MLLKVYVYYFNNHSTDLYRYLSPSYWLSATLCERRFRVPAYDAPHGRLRQKESFASWSTFTRARSMIGTIRLRLSFVQVYIPMPSIPIAFPRRKTLSASSISSEDFNTGGKHYVPLATRVREKEKERNYICSMYSLLKHVLADNNRLFLSFSLDCTERNATRRGRAFANLFEIELPWEIFNNDVGPWAIGL